MGETKQYDTAVRQILKYTHNFNILGEYTVTKKIANKRNINLKKVYVNNQHKNN